MKALRFHARRDLRVEEVPAPEGLGPKDVLLRNSFVGICGTDLHEYLAGPIFIPTKPHPRTGAKAPQILGHEYSGRVIAIGAEVTMVRPGDRVSVQPLVAPPDDYFTRRGLGQLANGLALVGLSWAWGGMGEMSVVREENVAVLPDNVSSEQGAMIEPAAVVVHAVDKGRVAAGHSVLVTGAGPIGALACLAASAAGATTILVSEIDPKRRERIRELGVVTEVFEPGTPEAARAIAAHTEGGFGVDVALECVGHEKALGTCIESVRRRGTIVQVGLLVQPGLVDISSLVTKDITLEGSWCYETTMWPRVIGLVASGKLPVERVVSARIGLDDAVRGGFDVLTAPGSGAMKILIQTSD
ncbi:zinc-binding dehydrogenase [Roseomonas gilardii]|uniref:zinc-binding dehydrogenase n=1 Tax=Roseomonas gilardii TaxID=257708 RepID=UPI0011AAB3AE|nr:zinc-binding dehydrogenase [Roseomonas gilardii]